MSKRKLVTPSMTISTELHDPGTTHQRMTIRVQDGGYTPESKRPEKTWLEATFSLKHIEAFKKDTLIAHDIGSAIKNHLFAAFIEKPKAKRKKKS